VTDVLGYYRLESPPALVTVDLDALIHEVVASLPPRLWHDAVLDVAPLPSVVGDPARLRVLFRQLLEGAHRLRGSEALEVGIMADEYDDGVRLSVTDNGLGTSGTSRGRTELRSGAAAGDEAGLGIAICRRIVEQHGGRIWIQSAPQRGTTVYLTLPKASPRDQHVYAGHRPSDSFVRFVASTGESP
jgi:signal transduction histidine kinase